MNENIIIVDFGSQVTKLLHEELGILEFLVR